MFSEIQDYFLKSGSKPCEKTEIYFINLKIDEDGKPALIKKKGDEDIIAKNKCAFDLAVKSLGNLKKWQPAEVKGKKIAAYFNFPFVPKDFFENYKSDYDINKAYQSAPLPGGMGAFRKEMKKSLQDYLDTDSYQPKGRFLVSFAVDIDGTITDIDIEPKVENYETFLEGVKFAMKKIKGKWTPAKRKGEPVKSWYRIPIDFNSTD
ncbi:energy transducer TonB [Chryseobacterium sp.]|uniref:energy transducer TonB n=1 Tax=Chryseobacterium sp. TaxID=1871047 RepID=UPI002634D408|nr:energy transducer TonB [Chryseobacterium sp.]